MNDPSTVALMVVYKWLQPSEFDHQQMLRNHCMYQKGKIRKLTRQLADARDQIQYLEAQLSECRDERDHLVYVLQNLQYQILNTLNSWY